MVVRNAPAAGPELEDGNIRIHSRFQAALTVVDADRPGGINGDHRNFFFQRDSERQKLGHGDHEPVNRPGEGRPDGVGAEGIGEITQREHAPDHGIIVVIPPVSNIEQNAPLPRGGELIQHAAIGLEDAALKAGVHVGQDIAFFEQRQKVLCHRGRHAAIRVADIDHERQAGLFRGILGDFNDFRPPAGDQFSHHPDFNPLDDGRVGGDAGRGGGGIDLLGVPELRCRAESERADMQQAIDCCFRFGDDVFGKTTEVSPARAPAVYDGGNALFNAKVVRIYPHFGNTVINMTVHVDETGGDDFAGDVAGPLCLFTGDGRRYAGDFPPATATSIMPSMSCAGSITRPPLMIRSNIRSLL